MMDLGTQAPDFLLPNTENQNVSLSDFQDQQVLVVAFICNHCPYVIHIAPALAKLADEYQPKGVGFVAINSNDVENYPADSPAKMREEKALRGYNFPYLFDETQKVAKAYDAACTPDLYVFNAERKLVYRGQFDDTRPFRISSGNYDSRDQSTGDDLKQALDTILAGQTPHPEQRPSIGCNIKWKPGNEPNHFLG